MKGVYFSSSIHLSFLCVIKYANTTSGTAATAIDLGNVEKLDNVGLVVRSFHGVVVYVQLAENVKTTNKQRKINCTKKEKWYGT